MFTVYILYSNAFCKTYVGYTSNIEERMKSHNFLDKKAWTTRYRPWTIIHTEEFADKSSAMKRELYFKTGTGRDLVKKLIEEKAY